MRKTESEGSEKALRGWYARLDNWIAGTPGQLVFESVGSGKQLEKTTEEVKLMVPADENQYACLLYGELFEDYFSQDMGEWMFKGAVYLNIPSKDGEVGSRDESAESGLIVHANCMSKISARDLGLARGIIMVRSFIFKWPLYTKIGCPCRKGAKRKRESTSCRGRETG
ncbi:hypothetical protein V6N13_072843 [Hibiscus sabdariffa]|uniref:PCFS4-like zinc finger domain-containing protein n=1 Tax=Hibiscus sabdariffa TaxID=183260 RepID=A0ABR2E7B7_9ROSI